jgi:hypothetical protein
MRKLTIRNGYHVWKTLRWPLRVGIPLVLLLISATVAGAIVNQLGELQRVDELHDPALPQHEDQFVIRDEEFLEVFEIGDVFFDTAFNALDGGGANVGLGQRFTRVPRADLRGAGEWFNHQPPRATGPNAAACTDCHREPGDGSGPAGSNVHRDPLRNGNLSQFIQRNTPHLFGPGAVQVLAEEMTEELHATREAARVEACQRGAARRDLFAKGIRFGVIVANRTRVSPCQVSFDTSGVVGVASDLVIRPFQWKGSNTTVRDFSRGASHNELGVTPNEIAPANANTVDYDGDGIANEATVGDMTALAVYLAAQPRPTTLQELASLGLIPPLSPEQNAAINRGRQVFSQLRCDFCHTPQLLISDPVFFEPSQNPNYRDATFPAPNNTNPLAAGLDPAHANSFNLTTDLPDNPVMTPGGTTLGNFRRDAQGRAIVELFGDLKRHNMGPRLNEPIDEVGTGAGTFLTENLWGVGSTAPYLHDGRATTLTEAILEHDGPGENTPGAVGGRDAANFFNNATPQQRADLIAFLENLVLFFMEEE